MPFLFFFLLLKFKNHPKKHCFLCFFCFFTNLRPHSPPGPSQTAPRAKITITIKNNAFTNNSTLENQNSYKKTMPFSVFSVIEIKKTHKKQCVLCLFCFFTNLRPKSVHIWTGRGCVCIKSVVFCMIFAFQ